jgi:hypothetical protein
MSITSFGDLALFLGTGLCLAVTSCTTVVDPEQEPMVAIGSYIPSIVPDREVEEFFSLHKIPFIADGSRAYQVQVPRSDAKRAINLLKQSGFGKRMTIYAQPVE